MNRRDFIQRTFLFTGLAAVIPAIALAERRRGGAAPAAATAGLALISPSDPMAKALNYVEKHSDIKDKNLKTEKNGIKFENQKCDGCAFYTKAKEATVSGKKAAPCQLLQNKGVVASGWCSSWAKMP